MFKLTILIKKIFYKKIFNNNNQKIINYSTNTINENCSTNTINENYSTKNIFNCISNDLIKEFINECEIKFQRIFFTNTNIEFFFKEYVMLKNIQENGCGSNFKINNENVNQIIIYNLYDDKNYLIMNENFGLDITIFKNPKPQETLADYINEIFSKHYLHNLCIENNLNINSIINQLKNKSLTDFHISVYIDEHSNKIKIQHLKNEITL